MGIDNLTLLLKNKCASAKKTKKLKEFSGKVLGIDTSIFFYKYLYGYNGDILEGFVRMILVLFKYNIKPIFIFDGKPPEEKNETIKSRVDKRNDLNTNVEVLNLAVELKKGNCLIEEFKDKINNFSKNALSDEKVNEMFEQSTTSLIEKSSKINRTILYVTNEHILQSKHLFDLFGIKWIHEECEAEALMAVLCKNGLIDGCISEDSDVLVNGGNFLLRDFRTDKDTIDEYSFEEILKCLQISHDSFIDMCILCGCDYTEKIKGIGPMNAYKLIQKYTTIEMILKNLDKKYIIPDNFNYIGARNLFKNPISNEIFDKIQLQFNNDDEMDDDDNDDYQNIKTDEIIRFLNENIKNEKRKISLLKDVDNYFS